jgi:hypothetical protein
MPSTAKAKSTIVAQLVRLARRERLSYTYCISRRNFRGGIHLRVR